MRLWSVQMRGSGSSSRPVPSLARVQRSPPRNFRWNFCKNFRPTALRESSRDEGGLPEFRSGSRSNILKGRTARCLRPTVGETLEDPSALSAVPDNPLSAMGPINAPPSSFVKQTRRSVTPPGTRLRSLHAKQHRLPLTLRYGTEGGETSSRRWKRVLLERGVGHCWRKGDLCRQTRLGLRRRCFGRHSQPLPLWRVGSFLSARASEGSASCPISPSLNDCCTCGDA